MRLLTGASQSQKALRIVCLFLIIAIGLFLRFATADRTVVEHPVRNDGKDYIAYAWNMKSFGVYSKNFDTVNQPGAKPPMPDDYRPPGYPLMLRALLNDRVDPAFWFRTMHAQALIAGLTLAFSVWLAIELMGAWPGLLTGLLVAISPHQSVYVPYFLTETLYSALLMAALGCAVISLKAVSPRRRYVWAGIGGVIFAALCLVRPTLNQWMPVLILLLVFPRVRRFRREILVCALAFFAVMSPWWLRNKISTHEMSDTQQMMITVQQGSYPNFMYRNDPNTIGYPYRYDPAAPAAVASWANVFSDLESKFSRDPVAMTQWYLVGKAAAFFHWSLAEGDGIFTYPTPISPWRSDRLFVLISILMQSFYVPLIICGFLGTIAAFSHGTSALFGGANADGFRLLAILHAFVIGVHVIAAPYARYSVPFRPLTFVLAVFFLVWMIRNFQALKETKSKATL